MIGHFSYESGRGVRVVNSLSRNGVQGAAGSNPAVPIRPKSLEDNKFYPKQVGTRAGLFWRRVPPGFHPRRSRSAAAADLIEFVADFHTDLPRLHTTATRRRTGPGSGGKDSHRRAHALGCEGDYDGLRARNAARSTCEP